MSHDTNDSIRQNGLSKKLIRIPCKAYCEWCDDKHDIPRLKFRGRSQYWEHVFVDASGQSDSDICPNQEYHTLTKLPDDAINLMR